eukprot:m.21698 g.21698  ORF g.21698 m.21698 type:complete len:61 (-) comp8323_c0_seq1:230-412(-)
MSYQRIRSSFSFTFLSPAFPSHALRALFVDDAQYKTQFPFRYHSSNTPVPWCVESTECSM